VSPNRSDPIRPGTAPFAWGDLRLELLGEKALWEPQDGVLMVADLHLGKAETFQAGGIPLPSDGDTTTLNALLTLAHGLRPDQVIVLGDLIHSRLGLTAELRDKLRALPTLLGCTLRLISGNHDQGSWLEGLRQEPAQALGRLWLSHDADHRPGRLNVCGHRHPVAVVGRGADRLRLPCFAYDAALEQLVLPAFGALTGGHPCGAGEQLWLVAEGTVMPWTQSSRPGRSRRAPGWRPGRAA
jgi:DNA ligase-associated metallophosphoesterase